MGYCAMHITYLKMHTYTLCILCNVSMCIYVAVCMCGCISKCFLVTGQKPPTKSQPDKNPPTLSPLGLLRNIPLALTCSNYGPSILKKKSAHGFFFWTLIPGAYYRGFLSWWLLSGGF